MFSFLQDLSKDRSFFIPKTQERAEIRHAGKEIYGKERNGSCTGFPGMESNVADTKRYTKKYIRRKYDTKSKN